jgi:putative ABC transport system permease protein
VVGIVKDAPYKNVREAILPAAYVPFQLPQRSAAFLVRTSGTNPLALASILRAEVPHARTEFRVSNVRAQADMVRGQTVRERLLAMLALFFAGVALILAGIGLYGVLDYSVLQRRREIGIRMAIGARPAGIARLVTTPIFVMVIAGAVAGLLLGRISARYVTDLLYQVSATDVSMLALPSLVLLAVALTAALPAVVRAVRIDPVEMLRSE